MARHGKKYLAAVKKYDQAKEYTIEDAVKLVKEMAYAKFDESVEVSVKLNLKKNHSIRDTIVLPNSFQKEKKILVFAKGEKADEAKKEGAAFVGAEELIEKVKGGWMDFDVVLATPDMMREVGKLGPVLGRRGLMPNPKTQTVSNDIKEAIAEVKKGRIEFRADKTGVVHLSIGKVSMNHDAIKENFKMIIDEVKKKRPSDLKGEYVHSIALSSTMGPGVHIDVKTEIAVNV
jgi:large subunit ribosomal protein L1